MVPVFFISEGPAFFGESHGFKTLGRSKNSKNRCLIRSTDPSEISGLTCLHPLGLAVLQLSGKKTRLASRRTCGDFNFAMAATKKTPGV